MTDQEKITAITTLVGNDSEATGALVTVYLNIAKEEVLNRLYPFNNRPETATVPTKYDYVECQLAARLFLKRGAEGESSHSENGINRAYAENQDLLNQIVPYADLR